ncbi:hypothetical protein CEXT_121031 [Caerostris extrusa]|uniref:Uncharacterized protein n=1 Tax=Caerostris extrusa TaxID=172846 RepID=A0AAV4QFB6_CAEEX|nr:hypothetical protein CEXT_121031 [Caerostris extrusa]
MNNLGYATFHNFTIFLTNQSHKPLLGEAVEGSRRKSLKNRCEWLLILKPPLESLPRKQWTRGRKLLIVYTQLAPYKENKSSALQIVWEIRFCA